MLHKNTHIIQASEQHIKRVVFFIINLERRRFYETLILVLDFK